MGLWIAFSIVAGIAAALFYSWALRRERERPLPPTVDGGAKSKISIRAEITPTWQRDW